MELRQLEVFRVVAEELHFGRAAERLHLAQPHLSRIVRALETDLGAPLFDRTTRRVELTPAGRALLASAEAMLRIEARARADVAAAQRGEIGTVRLSFAGPSSQAMVGRLACAVREEYAGIALAVRPGRYGPGVLADLLDRSTDLAIARFEHEPAEVDCRPVARERGVLMVPAAHPAAALAEVSLTALRREPFLALPDDSGSAVRSMFTTACRTAGFVPEIVQTAPDTWTCVALVAAGVGLHFTTDAAARQMPLDGVRVVPLAADIAIPPVLGYLVWRRGDRDPALERVLRLSGKVLPTVT
ncbi:LysR family transcriptional regulator [Nocardia puris]|uniref:LysR family transcriptional regulator n=1 Tax=Nocardia puris TaxID=208602 RepID=A0A366DWT0_9NOCA|nr:LysR substrate-binding domain-containing protein [Nocardia puris]MBF6209753.1 LysR family transcriptional regulator [Nocardia puris]MBF6366325.1 LysR family transcriptional regulator [Nocardia puris]MBF6458336.1 LysR family transcriptional regulator [Nocardia puris]RBO94512.1 LysR family transcriptional regulator [Nocardia puris]